MNFSSSKQRIYASLLALGSCVLLFRTIVMISEGLLDILALWVSILLIAELLIDVGCLFASIRWWIANDDSRSHLALKIGASAAILHTIRVLIFVLGRTGPWVDFDVKPEHRAMHYTRWSWGGVYFAAIMSVLGVIGVLIIWRLRRRRKLPS
jgi:hypothetical protein